ncbi:MAG TPA: hypothetical protein VFE14_20215 [Micromonosporaceae bacterium]|jgi:hypothetical protein|nr:hypothetical protein [Micromonosporaceae bacterium]
MPEDDAVAEEPNEQLDNDGAEMDEDDSDLPTRPIRMSEVFDDE